ncbi:hypothetical protein TNCV_2219721 [Trichonephila clavipes]|nr:hypothetical protein TNCV_2219721 [Trichonephila clavipes]
MPAMIRYLDHWDTAAPRDVKSLSLMPVKRWRGYSGRGWSGHITFRGLSGHFETHRGDEPRNFEQWSSDEDDT